MAERPVRVLIVDDNPGDARRIETMLAAVPGGAFEVICTERLSRAFEQLADGGVDAILLDLSLPDSQGLATFEAVHRRAAETPVVVLSGLDDEETALGAVHFGAQDYLAKGEVTQSLLVRSLRYAIERRRAERMQRAAESQIWFRAIFDKSPTAILVHDFPEGLVVQANGEFHRLTGIDGEEAAGRSPFELGDWARRPDLEALLRTFAAGDDVRGRDLVFRHPDRGPSLALVTLVGMDLGGARRVVWFLRDVTREREADRELRELPARLLRAQDEERRRIARDLHDGTASTLVAVSMDLAALRESAKSLDRKSRRLIAADIAHIDDCLREIRTLSLRLHPPLLDENGLASAVRSYAKGFAQRSGLGIDVEVSDDFGRLDGETENALFRVVQEGLTNVQRHARGRRARIQLTRDAEAARLEIRDGGRGGAPPVRDGSGAVEPGVGISGMRERLAGLGGHLELEWRDDGTTLRAIVPHGRERSA